MKKKLLSVLLCVSMAVTVLSGCGSKETDAVNDKVTDFEEPRKTEAHNVETTQKQEEQSTEPVDDDGIAFTEDGWHIVDGETYWYEGGVRQGVKYKEDGSIDESYKGKEIYYPPTDAWYLLDNLQGGAVAKNKDVYLTTEAGEWGDKYGDNGKKYGKWVRYDENGYRVHGWQTTDAGTYYFDPAYGTMARGLVTIDDARYYFDADTGVMCKGTTVEVDGTKYNCGEDGKIKYVMVWEKHTTYNSDGSLHKCEESEWDVNGRIIRKTSAENKDGYWEVEWEFKYERNINGQLVKETAVGDEIEDYEFEYDTNGNKKKFIGYNSDGSVKYWYEYEYDTNGNEIKCIGYNSDGSVRYLRECDTNGNWIKCIHYNSDGSVDWWEEYEYDTNGNEIKYIWYNSDGSVNWWEEYEYDTNGNVIKYIKCGSYYLLEHEYDTNGNEIKCIEYQYVNPGYFIIKFWYEWVYDTNGNEIKYIVYNSDGSVSSWEEYEYRYEYYE